MFPSLLTLIPLRYFIPKLVVLSWHEKPTPAAVRTELWRFIVMKLVWPLGLCDPGLKQAAQEESRAAVRLRARQNRFSRNGNVGGRRDGRSEAERQKRKSKTLVG
ncbi:uncharacterized [Tachysurus ichikawai]